MPEAVTDADDVTSLPSTMSFAEDRSIPDPPASSAYWAAMRGVAVFKSDPSAGSGLEITGGVLSQPLPMISITRKDWSLTFAAFGPSCLPLLRTTLSSFSAAASAPLTGMEAALMRVRWPGPLVTRRTASDDGWQRSNVSG